MIAPALAQTRVNLRLQGRNVDFSAASSTKPSRTGTTLPSSCSVGETFLKTDAPPGQNWYACTTANVWFLQSGGSGSVSVAGQLGDLSVIRTSSTTLTIGASCSSAVPCNVRLGNTVYSFSSSATATLTAGTGTAYIYVDGGGVLSVGHNLTLACSPSCTARSGITGFPPGSIPLWTWTASLAAWDLTGGADKRAFLSDRALAGGTGILTSDTGGQTTVAVDTATVPIYVTGTTLPATCTIGEQFINTSAPAGQNLYFCTAANTWTLAACPTCTTSAAALTTDAVLKGAGSQALTSTGVSIDVGNNIVTPGSLSTGSGAAASGNLALTGATSGTVTLTVPAVAGTGTWTLPGTTDTVVGRNTADTLTNKSLDTASGNVLKINGNTLTATAGSATVTVPNTTTLLAGTAISNTYSAGAKQSFQASATTAGHNIACSALPSTPVSGDVACDSADGNKLKQFNGTSWTTLAGGGAAGPLLDGLNHSDTTAGTVARGDLITGQGATPKWTRLAKGTAGQMLSMDATATDVIWTDPAGLTLATSGSGYWWPFGPPTTSLTTSGATTINATWFWQIVVPFKMTVRTISINISTAVAGANLRLALYPQPCSTGTTLLGQTANVSAGTAGVKFSSFASPVSLAPGVYWLGVSSDTAGLQLAEFFSSLTNTMIQETGAPRIASGAASTGSGATLAMPANCGTLTANTEWALVHALLP